MTLNITASPVVNAGTDQTVCKTSMQTMLFGSISGGSKTGKWTTTGTGTFIPNDSSLVVIYQFGSTDTIAGNITMTLSSTDNGNCLPESDQLKITFGEKSFAYAGEDKIICSDMLGVSLNGIVTGGSTTGKWSKVVGSGTFTPSDTVLNAVYHFSEMDSLRGMVQLRLISTNNGSCKAGEDDLNIITKPLPMIEAGSDQTICANSSASLAGRIVNAPAASWSTTGSGSFSPTPNALNVVYNPSQSDIAGGKVYLKLTSVGADPCDNISDSLLLIIQPLGFADAGSDQSYCANNADIPLNGSVNGGATKGKWITTGNGKFTPSDTALKAVYIASVDDKAATQVKLYLMTTNSCNVDKDSVLFTFTPSPTVDAGSDQSVCANNATVSVSGLISNATGGVWTSSGSGKFNLDSTSLNNVYMPSANEIGTGKVKLLLTTTGNGGCKPETDEILIAITSAPIVNAGKDENVCITGKQTELRGVVSGGATTGKWLTTGTGSFLPNDSVLNATYMFGDADTTNKSVKLYLVSTNNGKCLSVSDTVQIKFGETVYTDAGVDKIVCSDSLNVKLDGLVAGGSTTGKWSTFGGTGSFILGDTLLQTVYHVGKVDSIIGSVKIILTSTNNGSCKAGTDTLVVSLSPLPVVDAGVDQTICADDTLTLTGNIRNASGGFWTTEGTGIFIPDKQTLSAIYVPSDLDKSKGILKFKLTSTGNISCAPSTDSMNVSIRPLGIVNAGFDKTICANNASVDLKGIVSGGASKGKWTTLGSGHFLPSDTSLNTVYVSGISDISRGTVSLILEATNSCNIAKDTMTITYTDAPVVNAGTDVSVCANNPEVSLTGSLTVAAGNKWLTTGDGRFTKSDTILNTMYMPGVKDIQNGKTKMLLVSTGNGICNAVTDTLDITITPAPIVNAGSDLTICRFSISAQLKGAVTAGATKGHWTTSGYGTFSPDSSDMNTTYLLGLQDTSKSNIQIILISDDNGLCKAVSDTMIIQLNDKPNVSAGKDLTICSSDSSVSLNGIVNGGTSTGKWTTSGTGKFIVSDGDLQSTYKLSVADKYLNQLTFKLTSTNNGKCEAGTDSLVVSLIAPPFVNAGIDQESCFGTTINLSGRLTNALSGQWSTNGQGTFSSKDTILNNTYVPAKQDSISGQVIFVLTSAKNTICKVAVDSLLVKFVIPLIPDFTYTGSCINGTINFNDKTLIKKGFISGWKWDFGSGRSSTSQNATASFDQSGDQQITLKVQSDMGCTYSITKLVTVFPYPDVNFGFTKKCFNDTVNFIDSTKVIQGANIVYRKWSFGDNTSDTVRNPAHVFTKIKLYYVQLSVRTDQGCADSVTKPVVIYPDPSADFSIDGDLFEPNKTIYFTDKSRNADLWSWNFGDLSSMSNDRAPSHFYMSEGVYKIVQSVTNLNTGCVDTTSQNITIKANKPVYPPKVPSGFSPNEDGMNDTLYVRGGPIKTLEFKVYNKWGQLIFSTNDPSQGWDGYWKGVMQPIGVYTYTMKAVTINEKEYNKTGDVTLIR